MCQGKAELSFDPSILSHDKVKLQVWAVSGGLGVFLLGMKVTQLLLTTNLLQGKSLRDEIASVFLLTTIA